MKHLLRHRHLVNDPRLFIWALQAKLIAPHFPPSRPLSSPLQIRWRKTPSRTVNATVSSRVSMESAGDGSHHIAKQRVKKLRQRPDAVAAPGPPQESSLFITHYPPYAPEAVEGRKEGRYRRPDSPDAATSQTYRIPSVWGLSHRVLSPIQQPRCATATKRCVL